MFFRSTSPKSPPKEALVAASQAPAAQASWPALIKSLAGFSGDLASLTSPPWILAPVSVTEFPSYWGERPDTFLAIHKGETPEERARLVLAWFLSTLKGQFSSRAEKGGSDKKPLNPLLGETFYGRWPDEDGRGEITLVSEQVSHHPAITAYLMEHQKSGTSIRGASGQRTTFQFPSIILRQNGHAILEVKLDGGEVERYLITLPQIRVDGLLTGSLQLETTDTVYIQSSSGYLSTVVFSGRTWISGGVAHTTHATLTSPDSSTVLLKVEGQWDEIIRVAGSQQVFTDASVPNEPISVAPVSEQGPWESRRLWADVADGIRAGDWEKTSRCKSKMEVEQRARRQDAIDTGVPHQTKHFSHVASDPQYRELAALFTHSPAEEEFWLFNGIPPRPSKSSP